tara:strand:- start:5591 stop:5815 length:225 start_codon:yes stop_codon:yes gene_type:complete
MSEEKEFEPDWVKVVKISDKIDKVIDEGIKDGMNFIEIDFSLYMVKEKIKQEKHRIMNHMEAEEANKKGSNIYN